MSGVRTLSAWKGGWTLIKHILQTHRTKAFATQYRDRPLNSICDPYFPEIDTLLHQLKQDIL
jgi:hypothetical protein